MQVKSDLPVDANKPSGLGPGGQPFRVLVVDDSIFIGKQLSQILTSEGFQVVATATDGAQGVERYQALRPDLVTMDITMPVMDGVTALEKIIALDKNARVIMVSALGKEDVVKKCLLLGAKSFIIKPLDRKKVLERILAIIDREF
jgi:two-component system chemotaxis response regulator CheY